MLGIPWSDRTPNRMVNKTCYHLIQKQDKEVYLCGCSATRMHLEQRTGRPFMKRFQRTKER